MKKWFFLISFTYLIGLYSQEKSYHNQITNLSNKAENFIYKNKDSSYYFYDRAILLAINKKVWEDVIYTTFNCSDVAFYHYDFDRLNKNLFFLDSLYSVNDNYLKKLPNHIEIINDLNYYHGFYNFRINNYKSSKKAFKKIVATTENLKDYSSLQKNKETLSVAYNYLGKINVKEGKYREAIDYYNKNLRFINIHFSKNHEFLFSTYNLMAEALKKDNRPNESNRLYAKSIEFFNAKKSGNSTMSASFNVAENYIYLSKLDSAKFFLNVAKPYLTETHIYNSRFNDVYSKILAAEGNYKEAIKSIYTSLDFIDKKMNYSKNYRTALILDKIGEINSKFNKNDEALKNYNLALNQFSEDSINSTINQTIKFKILKHKTEVLNRLKNFTLSLTTSDEAISILDSIKPSFKNSSDKLFLIDNAFPLLENSIEAAYQLFKETDDSKYIDKAFFYSEKSKSTLLLESLLSTQATTFANIPEDLIEKEKQLKAKITYLEKLINKKSTSELQDELFDLKQDHRNLIKNIELNYKKYYDLKYNTQVLSRQELQDWLDEDTVLISYFYGNDNLYSITVTKNSKQFEVLKIDTAFETLLKDAYSLLSNPKSDLKLLKTKTHRLYQKLVKKSLAQSTKEKLIVIPDGLLNYLPFGSLSVNNNDYLINNHSISYVNSVTLLNQLKTKEQHNNQVLAFAPNFDNSNTSTLLSLPNSIKEVKQVLSHFKGEAFINEKASLKNFNSNNNNFRIIHLATHAILDDEHPEYSYLAFSPNSQDENSLYTNDLYNLELNADMVTLSACESGIGNLKRGEGMMSLARGFYFSGTASIASTLWKVNDASSTQLMDNFYENLAKGNTKDMALQKAKVNFINTNKDTALSHPYYWSGFIISGNTNVLTTNFQWQYLALGILMLIGLILVLFREKRRN